MSRATEILRQLVAIPSISTSSNRPIIEAAQAILHRSGWTTRQLLYIDTQGTEKLNLIAQPATQLTSEYDLAFVCHTDTVPFDAAAWPEATTLTERDGMLHGCGACDVKGSLAAILAAIDQTPATALNQNVALILTADEEIGCLGATRLLAEHSLLAKRVLVCEPTSLRPAVAGKGYGLAEVIITGAEAHSAFPQQGVSAIHAAAQMILKIREHAPTAHNPLFDPPHTTFNVGTIQGGTAKNIIPGECRFLVEWRPLPEEDPAAALAWLQSLAEQTICQHPGVTINIEARRADSGFAYDANSSFVQTLTKHLGHQPTGISFGSEATRFARIADEAVVLGPGNMHTAHSNRECIPIVELEAFTSCIAALLRSASRGTSDTLRCRR